mmetsp:Transcript_91/g.281  ORF Transcript_91/g.281 Transcript_91/m.281 type:complete len:87 (+) Transcript_91:322-582(+)
MFSSNNSLSKRWYWVGWKRHIYIDNTWSNNEFDRLGEDGEVGKPKRCGWTLNRWMSFRDKHTRKHKHFSFVLMGPLERNHAFVLRS